MKSCDKLAGLSDDIKVLAEAVRRIIVNGEFCAATVEVYCVFNDGTFDRLHSTRKFDDFKAFADNWLREEFDGRTRLEDCFGAWIYGYANGGKRILSRMKDGHWYDDHASIDYVFNARNHKFD